MSTGKTAKVPNAAGRTATPESVTIELNATQRAFWPLLEAEIARRKKENGEHHAAYREGAKRALFLWIAHAARKPLDLDYRMEPSGTLVSIRRTPAAAAAPPPKAPGAAKPAEKALTAGG